ncbi:stage 0 sporulation family protein [Oryzomonas sagensis]|uniref:Stage 0 sporulation family protein n=1 Tax=Oryzomonas sagensis TaxID=2603857 RepID=A0ABQ6TNU2_9BACT|nr:stage 0 sporulation family protein [Oryzomonas sagensis]KAB0669783.1 stage 0 sporulation family protein [Oryzomonas sagensis]
MPRIVAIQFSTAGKLYDFDAGNLDLATGDKVVVETERGLGIGTVLREPAERSEGVPENLVTIRRKATPDDMATQERNRQLEKSAFDFCLKRIMERAMPMKLVRVEYQFDSSKAVFYFTADGRVDFRDLVKDLAHTFHTRIEMRQIGVRDESKMIGGIGICGRELCCCSFLRDFQPVSVKMAKEQNLALNPSKISGQCGRLLCCLDYEYETYCCLRKNFPKCGKRVRTPAAAGVIDKINILTGNITLRLDDNKQITIRRDEILSDNAADALPSTPAAAPAPQPEARREQRERRHHQRQPSSPTPAPQQKDETREESKRAAVAPPPPAAEVGGDEAQDGQKKQEGRRRNRHRKHGHRRKQGDKPDTSTTPTPNTPGA